MNTRSIIINFVIIMLLCIGVIVWFGWSLMNTPTDELTVVKNTVIEFGGKLNSVSLLASDVKNQIGAEYGQYITPELLSQWIQDPSQAPGRLTSSPWPDRIEIDLLEKSNNGTYVVKGNIIEVTSQEVAQGGR